MNSRGRMESVIEGQSQARERTKSEKAAFVRFMTRVGKTYPHLKAPIRARTVGSVEQLERTRGSDGDE
jgi:hypothetical protein